MAYSTVYENIIFIEGDDSSAKKVGSISCDLSFVFGAQLKNLNDVKRVLAEKASANGCNCITNFTYGQKSRWLAIDDVTYKGSGIAAILSPERYAELCEKIKNR